jgi:hypothetical protein
MASSRNFRPFEFINPISKTMNTTQYLLGQLKELIQPVRLRLLRLGA